MQPRPEKPIPWWLETLVLTGAVFSVLLWPLAIILGGVVAVLGLFFAFTVHWAWGLLALALIAAAIAAFAWWEGRRLPRL